MNYPKLSETFRQANRIVICTHVAPDGDGIGAEVALYHYLSTIGKKVRIINSDPTPPKFRFLDPDGVIKKFGKENFADVDLLCVLDTHDKQMLGALEFLAEKVRTIFVDHHPLESNYSQDVFADPSCSSTGELLFRFLKHENAKFDQKMATALYVSILSDAHTFSFSGANAGFFEAAAELIRFGVSTQHVFHSVYAQNSVGKVRLLGHVLENVKTSAEGKLAWLTITDQMRRKYKATIEDTHSFADPLTQMKGVKIGAVFLEEAGDVVKVSLRGLAGVSVLPIATQFGGGGHVHAAGFRSTLPLERVAQQVIEAAQSLLNDAVPK